MRCWSLLALVALPLAVAAEYKLTLPEAPPFGAFNHLAPHIDERTVRLHFHRHQAAYVAAVDTWLQANQAAVAAAVPTDALVGHSLVSLLCVQRIDAVAALLPRGSKVHNAACQVYNHALYFAMMRQGGLPLFAHHHDHVFHQAMAASFGGVEAFLTAFKARALGHFGSGWVWLLLDTGRGHDDPEGLKIVETHDAGVPHHLPEVADWLKGHLVPLLVVDVWEHAYYSQRENRRAEYLDNWATVVDWQRVAHRYDTRAGETPLEDEEDGIVAGRVEYPRF